MLLPQVSQSSLTQNYPLFAGLNFWLGNLSTGLLIIKIFIQLGIESLPERIPHQNLSLSILTSSARRARRHLAGSLCSVFAIISVMATGW